jgi:hypothetical protein
MVIEAIQFTGANIAEIHAWANGPDFDPNDDRQWMEAPVGGDDLEVHIQTLEGEMVARLGDWVIKGVMGEFYPCKPDIFDATYEEA